jgi:transcriptional regulator with XRE-family HTH domain
MNIIERIENILNEKGIKQRELANKAGIAELSISRILTEKTKPTVDSLEKITKALDIELWELFLPEKSNDKLTALIEYKGILYKAKSIDELEKALSKIKSKFEKYNHQN